MLKNKYFPWIITALLLAPWFVYACQMSINGDTAWLLIAAERFLNGGGMLTDVYENNPPLSFLMHVPPVLLAKLGVSLSAGALAFFFALIGISLWAVSALLKRLDFLDETDRIAILVGFAASVTITPSVSFGEREHILLLGLMPFMLAQLALTWGYKLPRKIAWSVFGLGALAILLKPHYGVLPVFFFLHRAVKNKNLNFLRDADFIILAAVTAIYTVSVWVFFPDYVHTILPDVLALYLSSSGTQFALPALIQHLILFSAFLGIEAALSPLKKKRRELMILLYGSALLCLIPYAVQMKGFYYHLIPAMGFFLTALAFTLQSYARQYIKPVHWQKILPAAGIILLAYGNTPLLWAYPSHSDYKTLPLAAQLEKHCPEPCTYFAFHDTLDILSQTTLYTGATHASRFPSLWFLPGIYNGTGIDPAQQKILKDKYAGYVAEDLERYKPDVLFLMSNMVFADGKSFDLARYFSSNADFSKIMRTYRKTDSFVMNRADYLRGTDLDGDLMLAYDVYTKR